MLTELVYNFVCTILDFFSVPNNNSDETSVATGPFTFFTKYFSVTKSKYILDVPNFLDVRVIDFNDGSYRLFYIYRKLANGIRYDGSFSPIACVLAQEDYLFRLSNGKPFDMEMVKEYFYLKTHALPSEPSAYANQLVFGEGVSNFQERMAKLREGIDYLNKQFTFAPNPYELYGTRLFTIRGNTAMIRESYDSFSAKIQDHPLILYSRPTDDGFVVSFTYFEPYKSYYTDALYYGIEMNFKQVDEDLYICNTLEDVQKCEVRHREFTDQLEQRYPFIRKYKNEYFITLLSIGGLSVMLGSAALIINWFF